MTLNQQHFCNLLKTEIKLSLKIYQERYPQIIHRKVHKATSTAKNSINHTDFEGRLFQKHNRINYKVMCDKQAFVPFHACTQYKNRTLQTGTFHADGIVHLSNANLII
jgi:hypothetical protein